MRLCLVVLLSAAVCAATGGSWTGTLRDGNGIPVKGARVQLRAADRTLVAEAISSDAGAFALSDIAAGNYHIDVAINEKSWRDETALSIQEGEALAADLQLSQQNHELVIQFSQAQQGASPAPAESQKQGSGGEHLSSGAVSSLPLNARDFSKLLLLAAGTMTDANGTANFTQQFAVNGQRGIATVFAMDGFDTTDPEMGGATFSNFNVDAIQEVQANSGVMSAEIGHGAASFTNIIT